MNRFWHIALFSLLTSGCHGHKSNAPIGQKQVAKDSMPEIADSLEIFRKTATNDSVTNKDAIMDSLLEEPVEKKVAKIVQINKTEAPQTSTASIWTEEQVVFLNQAEKILLFNVRITEIGSRKLELDSQLSEADHQSFIKSLLSPESYPKTEMVEASDGKKFAPNYQMLLEAGEERLTLMFDKEASKMVVANLYGREQHDINPSLLEHVEQIKKVQ